MGERQYFIVRAVPDGDEEGVTADCPPGWSGTPDVGRGCYVVMHPTWQPEALVYGDDLSASDIEGLDDETFYSLLPIRLPATLTQDEIDTAAKAAGLEPVPIERLMPLHVGGA